MASSASEVATIGDGMLVVLDGPISTFTPIALALEIAALGRPLFIPILVGLLSASLLVETLEPCLCF